MTEQSVRGRAYAGPHAAHLRSFGREAEAARSIWSREGSLHDAASPGSAMSASSDLRHLAERVGTLERTLEDQARAVGSLQRLFAEMRSEISPPPRRRGPDPFPSSHPAVRSGRMTIQR
jgi:hypothetical protein